MVYEQPAPWSIGEWTKTSWIQLFDRPSSTGGGHRIKMVSFENDVELVMATLPKRTWVFLCSSKQKRSSIQKLESVSRLGRAGPDFGDPTKRKCILPLLISKRRHVSVLTQLPSIHLSTFWYMSSKSVFLLVEQDDSTSFI